MSKLFSDLPEAVKSPLRRVKNLVMGLPYRGEGRYCPVCEGASARFMPFGVVPRDEARCLHCGSFERHRFVWLYFQQHTDLFDGRPKKMLHVAPEPCFEPIFRKRLGKSYLSGDLYNPRAMVKMDITDIQYPDHAFDVVYCSHVLEHVTEDRKAMREFYRVLAPSGWAILNVPIKVETTFEDDSITDPKDRLRVFGQEDHVRYYGNDYVDRLREAGFKVKITKVEDLVSPEEAVRLGIANEAGDIFFCTK